MVSNHLTSLPSSYQIIEIFIVPFTYLPSLPVTRLFDMDSVTTEQEGQNILPEPSESDSLANKNNDTGTIHSDGIKKYASSHLSRLGH